MSDDAEAWKARALRLARAVDALDPNDEFCMGCGQYAEHKDGCVVASGELRAALADIKRGGKDRFDPAD